MWLTAVVRREGLQAEYRVGGRGQRVQGVWRVDKGRVEIAGGHLPLNRRHVGLLTRKQRRPKTGKLPGLARTDGGRGREAENILASPATPRDEAPEKERHLRGERARVEVGLVEHDDPQVLPEEDLVLRARKHVLEHRVVGDDDVGRRAVLSSSAVRILQPTRLLARAETTRVPDLFADLVGGSLVLGCLAREVKEGELGLASKPVVEPLHLVVHERVHGIQDERAHALPWHTRRVEERAQRRQEEALGLSGARASRHHHGRPGAILSTHRLGERLGLMGEQRTIARHRSARVEVPREALGELAAIDERLQREARVQRRERALDPQLLNDSSVRGRARPELTGDPRDVFPLRPQLARVVVDEALLERLGEVEGVDHFFSGVGAAPRSWRRARRRNASW